MEDAHRWLRDTLEATDVPPAAEADCGERCAAFTYLGPTIPFIPFSFPGWASGLMLVYDASPAMWEQAQCMAVTDSFTTTRVCCTCSDVNHCPFNHFVPESALTECNDAHTNNCSSALCRQLAAGCGPSLYDLAGAANGGWGHTNTDWGSGACDADALRHGRCDACHRPYWCDDEDDGSADVADHGLDSVTIRGGWSAANATNTSLNTSNQVGGPPDRDGYSGRVTTPQAWVDAFGGTDGGYAGGTRQCKFKPSQRPLFVESVRQRFRRQLERAHPLDARPWNEVNAFVDRQGHLSRALWDNLIGLM
jgi:hypothetical protein